MGWETVTEYCFYLAKVWVRLFMSAIISDINNLAVKPLGLCVDSREKHSCQAWTELQARLFYTYRVIHNDWPKHICLFLRLHYVSQTRVVNLAYGYSVTRKSYIHTAKIMIKAKKKECIGNSVQIRSTSCLMSM